MGQECALRPLYHGLPERGTITLERFKVIAGGHLQIILDHEDLFFSPLLPKKRAENGGGIYLAAMRGRSFRDSLIFSSGYS
jgi:hypothetical protein